MLEIRTYTLASVEALDQYASVHWKRHIPSLAAHGITTHHVWREVAADVPRLVALVEYDNGADPAEATKTFMHSGAIPPTVLLLRTGSRHGRLRPVRHRRRPVRFRGACTRRPVAERFGAPVAAP